MKLKNFEIIEEIYQVHGLDDIVNYLQINLQIQQSYNNNFTRLLKNLQTDSQIYMAIQKI